MHATNEMSCHKHDLFSRAIQFLKKISIIGAGEMLQWLRALMLLPRTQDPHARSQQSKSSSQKPELSSDLHGLLNACDIHAYTQAYTHKHKIEINTSLIISNKA